MRQEYIDYWKNHRPACVGLAHYGKKWYVCWANGSSTKCAFYWNWIPKSWITWNEKGIRLGKNKNTI